MHHAHTHARQPLGHILKQVVVHSDFEELRAVVHRDGVRTAHQMGLVVVMYIVVRQSHIVGVFGDINCAIVMLDFHLRQVIGRRKYRRVQLVEVGAIAKGAVVDPHMGCPVDTDIVVGRVPATAAVGWVPLREHVEGVFKMHIADNNVVVGRAQADMTAHNFGVIAAPNKGGIGTDFDLDNRFLFVGRTDPRRFQIAAHRCCTPGAIRVVLGHIVVKVIGDFDAATVDGADVIRLGFFHQRLVHIHVDGALNIDNFGRGIDRTTKGAVVINGEIGVERRQQLIAVGNGIGVGLIGRDTTVSARITQVIHTHRSPTIGGIKGRRRRTAAG